MIAHRKYKSYEEYVKHQLNKTASSKTRRRLRHKRQIRKKWFNKHLSILDKYLVKGLRGLCLAARDGAEVEVFKDRGYKAIGIDLVAFSPFVIKGDFHKIPFKDNSFDFIYSNSVDHVFDIEKFSSEVNRVLKKGGYVLFHLALTRFGEYEVLYLSTVDDLLDYFPNYSVVEKSKIGKPGESLRCALVLRKNVNA